MSTDLKILFNPKQDMNIESKQLNWTDVQPLEDYVNDREIKFEDYSHEIALYKLAKSEGHWAEIEFINEFKKLIKKFDRTIPPCMVMNCDILVGYLNDNDSWNLIGESKVAEFEEIYHKELLYIIEKISPQ